jgi:hypothetical protein
MIIGLSVLKVHAESLSGVVSKGSSIIKYNVDLSSGEYSIDLKNAYNPKILISANDLSKVDCEKEDAIVKGIAGGLSISNYKRDTIEIGLSISDISLNSIEGKIIDDISNKGYHVPKLTRTTKFYMTSPVPEFEWYSDALSIRAKSHISQILEEKFRKFVKDRDSFENYNNLETSYMKMPIHIFVCDLINKKVVMKWNSSIQVSNESRKEPTLSKTQIVTLSNYLLSNTDKLKKSSEHISSMDEFSQKIVKSSALMAFGLAKQGFDANIINSINFDWVFDKMFSYPSFSPKKLTDSDVQEIQNMTTDTTTSNSENIQLIEKEIKIEALK